MSNGHPIYEFMVGDTVVNLLSNRTFQPYYRKPFIIKTASMHWVPGYPAGYMVGVRYAFHPKYQGFIENLGQHWYPENELRTSRMVIVEKDMGIRIG